MGTNLNNPPQSVVYALTSTDTLVQTTSSGNIADSGYSAKLNLSSAGIFFGGTITSDTDGSIKVKITSDGTEFVFDGSQLFKEMTLPQFKFSSTFKVELTCVSGTHAMGWLLLHKVI